jgi:adenosine deaminase
VAEIPKVELHLHLEGAIPLGTLLHFIRRKGEDQGITNIEDLRKKLVYTDFAHFIDVWTWKNSFIKEEGDFEKIAYEVLCDLSSQNVRYVEAFYAPGDYWRQGLSVEGITRYLIQGKERAYRDFGIRSELIIDLIRDHGPERSRKYMEEATQYLGRGLIGVGLGGSEQEFPADPYASLYEEARERGFRLTAHAGEVAGADSVWTVVRELGVERVGHGVRAHEDPELMSWLKERQVPLEMCVSSNVMTGVCSRVEEHPIRDYFEQGLMVTVNSDDPTMFNTSITQEYLTLIQKLQFTATDLKRVGMNGIAASFMSDTDKDVMRTQFKEEWKRLEARLRQEDGGSYRVKEER